MPRKKSSALDIAAAVGLTCVIQPLMNALTNFMLVPSHWLRLHSALTSFSFQIPKPHLPFRLASPGRCLLQWKSILSRVLDGKPLAVHVYDDNKNDVIANTRGLHPWMNNKGGSQMTLSRWTSWDYLGDYGANNGCIAYYIPSINICFCIRWWEKRRFVREAFTRGKLSWILSSLDA